MSMLCSELLWKVIRTSRVALNLALLTLLFSGPATSWGHGLQFSTLNLEETSSGSWNIQFQYSDTPTAMEQAKVIISNNCRDLSNHRQKRLQKAYQESWTVNCENPSTPLQIKLEGLTENISTLIHLTSANGLEYEALLKPGNMQFEPAKLFTNTPPQNHYNFIIEGIKHILSGLDHLLFLLLILLLISNNKPKTLLLTITAFTLGHSATLSLAVLDVIRISPLFTETLIAASLVFLAAEIVRNKPTITFRFPAVIAGFFGLFHGLGFANSLAEIMSNSVSQIWALATFNIGVEIGQLLFVVPCWIAIRFLNNWAQISPQLTEKVTLLVAYCGGTLGVVWAIQRMS